MSILGPRILVDMFFLHQRGRAFTILHVALNLGASAGPTFSGFVGASGYWPVEYWWHVALTAFTLIPVLIFLEDTTYDRSPEAVNRKKPESWIQDRRETFFFGTKIVPGTTWLETVRVIPSSSPGEPPGELPSPDASSRLTLIAQAKRAIVP